MHTLRIALLTLAIALLLPCIALALGPPEKNLISQQRTLNERKARMKKIDKQHAKAYDFDSQKAKHKRPASEIIIHEE